MTESSAYVTSTSDTLRDLTSAFGTLQQDMVSAEDRFQAITAEQAEADVQTTRDDTSFFVISNPGLWLLWGILAGATALLIALRRDETAFKPAIREKKQTSEILPGSHVQPITQGSSEAVLVNPVKIVKIKVRKIKK